MGLIPAVILPTPCRPPTCTRTCMSTHAHSRAHTRMRCVIPKLLTSPRHTRPFHTPSLHLLFSLPAESFLFPHWAEWICPHRAPLPQAASLHIPLVVSATRSFVSSCTQPDRPWCSKNPCGTNKHIPGDGPDAPKSEAFGRLPGGLCSPPG